MFLKAWVNKALDVILGPEPTPGSDPFGDDSQDNNHAQGNENVGYYSVASLVPHCEFSFFLFFFLFADDEFPSPTATLRMKLQINHLQNLKQNGQML
jgi:hypothetical protein